MAEHYYKLEGGVPVEVSRDEWDEWMDRNYDHTLLARTRITGVREDAIVTTKFIGIADETYPACPTLNVFTTDVFGGPLASLEKESKTMGDALKEHERWCKAVRALIED